MFVFTINMVKSSLKFHGVWRAKIIDKMDGTFEILVPKTSHKKMDWVNLTFPSGVIIEVGILDNPLHYKKYTYLVED